MTEVQTDWENAPEGATHYIHVQSDLIFFKIKSDAVFCFTKSGGWKRSVVTAAEALRDPDYVAIPRPTSTAISELKKLSQAVFNKLPDWVVLAVINDKGQAIAARNGTKLVGSVWHIPQGDYFGMQPDALLIGEGYDTTDWQNSLIEREPTVAEILEAFAANPPNFDALINSVANAQTLAEAQAEIELLRAEVDNRKAAHEATADSFARILAALDHASPASIVHHLNGEGACLQMINDIRYRIEQVTAEIERLKVGHDRYEILRKLNVVQFQKLYTKALKGGVSFDQVVDLYGEFFDEN